MIRKYVVMFHDGIGPANSWPEEPDAGNTASTIAGAIDLFREIMRDSGSDYTRADGYGQPYADVTLSELWDGVSYGDSYLFRLTRGPRGGVVRESW